MRTSQYVFLASAHSVVKPHLLACISRIPFILCKTYEPVPKFSRLPHGMGLGIVRARRIAIRKVRQENKKLMKPAEGSTVIGKSVIIRGELSGNEDLYIDGDVEGTVTLPESRLTIGPNARVLADISARDVIIFGQLNGKRPCLRVASNCVSRPSSMETSLPAGSRSKRVPRSRVASSSKPPSRTAQPHAALLPQRRSAADSLSSSQRLRPEREARHAQPFRRQ